MYKHEWQQEKKQQAKDVLAKAKQQEAERRASGAKLTKVGDKTYKLSK